MNLLSTNKLIATSALQYSLFNIDENIKDTELIKKINMTFKSLCHILKILLLKVDDELYQRANTDRVIFPENLDKLTLIVGTFNKAFNEDIIESLYNLVSLETYTNLYKISNINSLLVSFVIDDDHKLNVEMLLSDYLEAIPYIKDFVCLALDVDTDLNDHSIIEEGQPIQLSQSDINDECTTEDID